MDWNTIKADLNEKGINASRDSGYEVGRLALGSFLGAQRLADCAEEFIGHGQSSELGRSILMVLRPSVAIAYCAAVVDASNSSPTRRHTAARLLCDIANEEIVPSISKWLSDADPDVQRLSARIVEDSTFRGDIRVPEALLQQMSSHQNPFVRKHYEEITRFLSEQASGAI